MQPIVETNFPSSGPKPGTLRAREAAEQLETAFVAEMLKSAGFGESRETFGGGAGEEEEYEGCSHHRAIYCPVCESSCSLNLWVCKSSDLGPNEARHCFNLAG